MTGIWLTVLLVGAVSMALKSAGPVILGGRELPGKFKQVVALMAPTLLAALIATQIFASGSHLTFDARVVGLGVGAAAIMLRVPTLLVVVLAAMATALTRLAFPA